MLRPSELPQAEAQAQHDNKIGITFVILIPCSSSPAKKNQVEGPLLQSLLGSPPAAPVHHTKVTPQTDYLYFRYFTL